MYGRCRIKGDWKMGETEIFKKISQRGVTFSLSRCLYNGKREYFLKKIQRGCILTVLSVYAMREDVF